MAGTSPGQAAPGQPAKNTPKGQRKELHDKLMRELDERDTFVAEEARKASAGLSFRTLPLWKSMKDGLEFVDVWKRYTSQDERADKFLVRSTRRPTPKTTSVSRNGLFDSDEEETPVPPVRKPAPKTAPVQRKGLLALAGFTESDEEEEQAPASAPTSPPVTTKPTGLLERFGLMDLVEERDSSTPPSALPLRVGTSEQREPSRTGRSRSVSQGMSSMRDDSTDALRGRRDQGDQEDRESATSDLQITVRYPKFWTRWMPYGGDEDTLYTVFIEQPGAEKKEVLVEKLDSKVYGGDNHHDLGLCKAHFTQDETCPFSWEECPYRHWRIEPLEELWVNSAWLEETRALGLRPLTAPDWALVRYEGRPRQLVSGEWFSSSSLTFAGEYRSSTDPFYW